MGDDALVSRWSARAEALALVCAVAFLAAYAVPILQPDLSAGWLLVCRWTTWTTWAVLVADVVIRLVLADDRWLFLRRNALAVASVALPVLRPLRLLRLVLLVGALHRYVGHSLRGRVALYVGGSVGIVGLVASLAILDAERSADGSNIRTFGDATWWVMTTLSTVGYGDHYPVTTTGRLIAVTLMIVGVALLGVVTASLASWLIAQVREIEDQSEIATRREVTALVEEVRQLRRALDGGPVAKSDGAHAPDRG